MKPTFYDFCIGAGSVIFLLIGIICFPISLHISFLAFLAFSILIWGSFIEPRIITINRVRIPLKHATHSFTIAVLTDLHAGPYKKTKFFERVVARTIALNPDLVVIVGDHVYNCITDLDEVTYLSPLKKLALHFPVYAVHGNHEYGMGEQAQKYTDVSEHVKKIMQSYGIIYLQNEIVNITVNEHKITLFGGDEVWAHKLDYTSLTTPTISSPTIALIHNPAYLYHPHPKGVDLTISGHTHGGQLRLPFIGPIARVDRLIPRHMYYGLHTPERPDEFVFISRGLGESEPRARLYCPPEIALLEITHDNT